MQQQELQELTQSLITKMDRIERQSAISKNEMVRSYLAGKCRGYKEALEELLNLRDRAGLEG